MGASSGIGLAVARLCLAKGYCVGLAARRVEILQQLEREHPGKAFAAAIDVCEETLDLLSLVERMGGMDIYLHVAGVGKINPLLEASTEHSTTQTNVIGFTRCLSIAFRYFEQQGYGHIAAISSIAGTKGIGIAPAYSASKAFQNTYLEALSQLTTLRKLSIYVTDLRPGFVKTDFLDPSLSYPMMMSVEKVAAAVVASIERKEAVRIIDWRYRLLVFFWRLLPAAWWRKIRVKV